MSHMGRPYLLYCYFFFNMSKIIGIYKMPEGMPAASNGLVPLGILGSVRINDIEAVREEKCALYLV